MKRGMYLKLQLKRGAKLYPAIISITLLLILSITVCGMVILNMNASKLENQKVSIGIVGDLSNTYLDVGVEAIKNLDASRFSIDFITMDEETALEQLESGEITGYVRIPAEFVDAITSMKNVPVTYVTNNAPTGFGSIMMIEVSKIISELVTESQSAIYGMQNVAREHGKTQEIWDKTESFSLQYVEFILNRSGVYQVDFTGVADALSMGGYYICGGIMFFLLLWGISCNTLLIKKDVSLETLLCSKGQSTVSQISCELTSYLTVTFVTFLLFATIAGLVLQNFSVGIGELDRAFFSDYLLYIVGILPVLLMVCAMQVFFYELFSGSISAILFQFVFAVGTGYIAGCFYPSYFFPVSVQKFAACLPTGVGFTYLRQCMSSTLSLSTVAFVLLYALFFFALAVLARKYRTAVRLS